MRPVDHAQRERALDPSRSFIVQAPAGSGKTELLIQRYLRLLSTVQRPESVVAITFTKKAAAEMQRRVLEALQAARGGAPPEEHAKRTWELAHAVLEQSKKNGWTIAENPRRMSIRTIDSLCSALVNRMPWLSRLGPRLEIVEKADDLYREAGRRTLELLETEDYAKPVGRLLRHFDGDQSRLTKLLREMLARRDQWLRHVIDPAEQGELRERYEGMLRHRVRTELEKLCALAPGFLAERLPALARHAARRLPETTKSPGIAVCCDLEVLPGPNADDLPRWNGLADLLLTNDNKVRSRADRNLGFDRLDKAAKQRMENLLSELKEFEGFREQLGKVRNLPPPHFDDAQWEILEAMLVTLKAAAGELRLVFDARGQVDFAALTEAALAALGEDEAPTDLALALDGRIEHLLVDEFQDTSQSQMRLLEKLTLGWSAGDGRTVFLVGDPMQSIYRFREAEVGLFLRTVKQGLPSVEIEPLKLSVNFRSRRNVVDWVNDNLEGVFAQKEDVELGAVRFSRSDCASAEPPDIGVQAHSFFYPDGDDEEGGPEEAERVRNICRRALGEGKSVAVLARARTHLPRILAELRGAGIGYQALEIDRLDASPAVRDLFALTSALLHPGDRVSWLAILRARWCGLTLPDLHALTEGALKAAIPALLQDPQRLATLSPEGQARARGFLDALDVPRPTALRAWVEAVWLRLGGPATIATAAGLDDAEAFFDLVEKLDRGCDVDLDLLRLHLEDLYAAPDPAAGKGVQVMTIHKAKGLEFDAVILPGLARAPASDGDRLLLWLESPSEDGFGEGDVLLAPIKAADAQSSPVYNWVRGLETEKQKQEEARLLYVAATRARSELHLMGAVKVKDGKSQKAGRGTLLHRLWDAIGSLFEKPQAGHVSHPADQARPALSVARFVADWRPPLQPRQAAEDGRSADKPKFDTRYRWAAQRRRVVGTVVHDLLQEVGRAGAAAWDAERLRAHRRRYEIALQLAGLSGGELEKAANQVEQAVLRTLEDERGRWILDIAHDDARSEVSLAGAGEDGIVERRVDRTFIDEHGVRWIVDFKTTPKERGMNVEGFIAVQMERYREQMFGYRALYRRLEKRPVRIGLYFPLLGAWREYDEAAGAAAV